MTDVAQQMRGLTGGTTDARTVAIGSSGGAIIETYDFIGFGAAALPTRETFGSQERRLAAQTVDPVPVSVDHPLPDHQHLSKESR